MHILIVHQRRKLSLYMWNHLRSVELFPNPSYKSHNQNRPKHPKIKFQAWLLRTAPYKSPSILDS